MAEDRRHRPYPFAGGLIYLDVDYSPAMLARAQGRYEVDRIALLQRYLRPGMTFVDVGANMGDYSLIAAKLMNDDGRVLAFEPWPENCYWMRRSVDLNGYRCIRLTEIALSDTPGQETLYVGDRIARHSLLPRPRDQEEVIVDVDTLDGALAAAGAPHADIIKIDVEGGEIKVLRGAAQTLGRDAPMKLIVEVHGGRIDAQEVWSLLTGYGFSIRLPADPDTEIEFQPGLGEIFAVKGG